MTDVDRRWVVGRAATGPPRVRLLCLAQAGGAAGAFAGWRPHLPEGLEIVPIELPGRGTRLAEPLADDVDTLVGDLADALGDDIADDYALFGHSFGGLLAYELAIALVRAGHRPPVSLLVSAVRAPHVAVDEPLHLLDDDALLAHLRRIDGLPEALLRHRPYVDTVLRAVRADLRLADRYHRRDPFRVPFPLHVLGGLADPIVPPDTLGDWERCAGGDFSVAVYPGDHFYLYRDPAPLLRDVAGVCGIE